MKIVLVNPPLHNTIPAATPDFIEKTRGIMPPMGLLYLKAALENSCHNSFFIDASAKRLDNSGVAKKILTIKPDFVGIQTLTFNLPGVYLLIKEIKSLLPKVKIILGGAHPTIYPLETGRLKEVDFVFTGDSEYTLVSFLNNYPVPENSTSLSKAAYLKKGNIISPLKTLYKNSIDLLPYPARKSSPYMQYSSIIAKSNPITCLITSRGCPFNCIFCNRRDKKYYEHSAEYVLGEIESILSLGIKEIFIHDDTFTINRNRAISICKGVIKMKTDLLCQARTRVDCVDRKMLSYMKEAGCSRLSFGIESGSKTVLKRLKKNISLEKALEVFKWCKEEGIETLADFMVGCPGEKKSDVKRTNSFIRKLKPEYIQFSICTPYPDTELYKEGLDKGIIKKDVWRILALNPLVKLKVPFWTENFSRGALKKILITAYLRFYLTFPQIFNQLKKINSIKKAQLLMSALLRLIFYYFSRKDND